MKSSLYLIVVLSVAGRGQAIDPADIQQKYRLSQDIDGEFSQLQSDWESMRDHAVHEQIHRNSNLAIGRRLKGKLSEEDRREGVELMREERESEARSSDQHEKYMFKYDAVHGRLPHQGILRDSFRASLHARSHALEKAFTMPKYTPAAQVFLSKTKKSNNVS